MLLFSPWIRTKKYSGTDQINIRVIFHDDITIMYIIWPSTEGILIYSFYYENLTCRTARLALQADQTCNSICSSWKKEKVELSLPGFKSACRVKMNQQEKVERTTVFHMTDEKMNHTTACWLSTGRAILHLPRPQISCFSDKVKWSCK